MPTPPVVSGTFISRLRGTMLKWFRVGAGIDLDRQANTPSDPQLVRNAYRLYLKEDNQLYLQDSDLNEIPLVGNVTPNGRLFVPAAYYQTTGSQNTQLNGADDSVTFSFVAECDFALSSISLHVGAVGTQGDINLSLKADSSGNPGTEIYAIGTVDSGAAAGWVRKTLAVAQQLSRKKRYHLVITGTASKDFSISSRHVNTANGAMFPDGCYSKTNLNGAGTWTALTQNAAPNHKSALLNIILNSQADHCPQLLYGRYNGQYVYIPGSGVMTVPEVGVSLDCSALTAGTEYYAYLYSNAGTLTLEASDTAPSLDNGVEVKPGETTKRCVGSFVPVQAQTGKQGPVDVADYRAVNNRHNKVNKTFGKLNPYAAATYLSTDTTWREIADFRIFVLSDLTQISAEMTAQLATGGQAPYLAMAVDGVTPTPDNILSAVIGASGTNLATARSLSRRIDLGLHYISPWYRQQASTGGAVWLYNDPNTAIYLNAGIDGEVFI